MSFPNGPGNVQKARDLLELMKREIIHGDVHGLDYLKSHERRFLKTFEFVPNGRSCLEIGATSLFQLALGEAFGFETVNAISMSNSILEKRINKEYRIGDIFTRNMTFSIDVESELLPFSDKSLDFVLCCEVIEHLDVDPMFMMIELNRVLADGGQLLITTPNACSARNFWKIAKGYRPHFFTQYLIDRSPYRHNFEYDIHGLVSLATASGFEVSRFETHDVFEAAHDEALHFLKTSGFPVVDRGDDIFLLLRKAGSPQKRYPKDLYA
jgi:SAM-dependent methyltransferase